MTDISENTITTSIVSPEAYYYNDPYEKKEWYYDGSLLSSLSIDVYSVWKDYTGTGVKVGVIDSQIDYRHADLSAAYDTSADYNFALGTDNPTIDASNLPYYHGTAVAGVISAQANNTTGTVGIAWGATLVGLGIDYSSDNVSDQIVSALNKSVDLDVVNNSWSFTDNFSDNFAKLPELGKALVNVVANGRDGLGTSLVFAAGNAGIGGSSNYHNFQNSPYTIAVGAVNPDGTAAGFTSVGANVLLSAGGANVYTTTVNNRYLDVSGTSFAAPAVSATIALMLQANPNLGYRDIQQILAYSAQRQGLSDTVSFGDGWQTNGATNSNGGGMHFSDAFGYGMLNVHDAVRLAETWNQQQTYANLSTVTKTVKPEGELVAGSNDHVGFDINVTDTIDVEHVQLSMDLRWINTGDLDVYLTSPDGTQVRLVYDLPDVGRGPSLRNFTFDSVASMGELSTGTWHVDIYTRNPAALDQTGSPMTSILDGVTLTLTGSAASHDNTYIYTDELGTLYSGADLAARSVLNDSDGGTDAINAAAVTSATTIDLTAKTQTTIAGVKIALAANTIENVYTGDGNDTVTGSSAANVISTGRGNDVINYSAGKDTIDGGTGTDKMVFGCSLASLTGCVTSTGEIDLTSKAGDVSKIMNVETFAFTDGTYSYADLAKLLGAAAVTTPPATTTTTESTSGSGTGTGTGTGTGAGTDTGTGASNVPTTFDETTRAYAKTLTGTAALDKINGTALAELIHGQDGDDTINGKDGNDAIYGDNGDDKIHGNNGDDYVGGGAGNDKLWGDAGNDKLEGGAGADLIRGGDGDDWLHGGAGIDKLYGDAGADTFVYDVSDLGSVDYIYDFNAADGDRILLTGMNTSNATFDFVTKGANMILEMHDATGTHDIFQVKGAGLGDLVMGASELGLVWA